MGPKITMNEKFLVFYFREGLFLCLKSKIQNFLSCVVMLNVVIASVVVPIMHTSTTKIIELKIRWRIYKNVLKKLGIKLEKEFVISKEIL
jgi:hypothetical protein